MLSKGWGRNWGRNLIAAAGLADTEPSPAQPDPGQPPWLA